MTTYETLSGQFELPADNLEATLNEYNAALAYRAPTLEELDRMYCIDADIHGDSEAGYIDSVTGETVDTDVAETFMRHAELDTHVLDDEERAALTEVAGFGRHTSHTVLYDFVDGPTLEAFREADPSISSRELVEMSAGFAQGKLDLDATL